MGKNTTSQKKKKKSKRGAEPERNNIKNTPRANYNDLQFYGSIERTLGNCRFLVKIIFNDDIKLPENVKINTSEPIIAHLPRSQKRGGYINDKMIVLISHRGFQHKADICYLYKDEEVRYLIDIKEIPPYSKQFSSITADYNSSYEDNNFDFDYNEDDNTSLIDENTVKNYDLHMPTSSEEDSAEEDSAEEDPGDFVILNDDEIISETLIKNNTFKKI